MPYIVCEKRRGNPKVNVEVCRRKCKFIEECKSYERYLSSAGPKESSLDIESHTDAVSRHARTGEEIQVA